MTMSGQEYECECKPDCGYKYESEWIGMSLILSVSMSLCISSILTNL